MIFIPFLVAIPGSIALVGAVSRLSPWPISNRATPLLMILACLLLMFLPLNIALAFAAAPIAALVAYHLRIDFTGHDPANWSWMGAVARRTVTSIRRPPKVPVTNFLDRAFPNPEQVAVAPVAPVATSDSSVPKYVPDL